MRWRAAEAQPGMRWYWLVTTKLVGVPWCGKSVRLSSCLWAWRLSPSPIRRSADRQGLCCRQARRSRTHRARRDRNFAELTNKAGRQFPFGDNAQPFALVVLQLRRGKTRVQMQTCPLGQMVHDCNLILRTKQPVGKNGSRPLHNPLPALRWNKKTSPAPFVSMVTKMRNFPPSPPECDRWHSLSRLSG